MNAKARVRVSLLIALFLLIMMSAIAVFAEPASAPTANAFNRVWFSVPVTNYEVAIQVRDPAGWTTKYTRDSNTARNNHPFDFYDLGQYRYRVLLSKVNGVYVNRQCGAEINFTASFNVPAERACQ